MMHSPPFTYFALYIFSSVLSTRKSCLISAEISVKKLPKTSKTAFSSKTESVRGSALVFLGKL